MIVAKDAEHRVHNLGWVWWTRTGQFDRRGVATCLAWLPGWGLTAAWARVDHTVYEHKHAGLHVLNGQEEQSPAQR